MTKAYEINWSTNTITMTKKFAAEASEYGTSAYNLLMDIRSKGFNIEVRKPAKRKSCPTRLTFKKMRIIVSSRDCGEQRLAQLEAVIEAGKGQKNQYEYVRKWFLTNYPDFSDTPDLAENNCLLTKNVKPLSLASNEDKKIA